MAKITLENGITIEGTAVGLAEMVAQMNAKAGVVEDVVDPLKVGDYAKVVRKDTTYNMLHEVGAIVQISEVDEDSPIPYEATGLDGKGSRWFKPECLTKIPDEEVASLKVRAKSDAVFTDAGRKPNEYRKGDIVRVINTKSTTDLYVGQITEVITADGTDEPDVRSNDGGGRYAKVEIVTFVENRLDRN